MVSITFLFQNSVFMNLRELSREKSLIAAGNRELDHIKKKLGRLVAL